MPFHRITRHHRLPLTEPRRWENDVEHSWTVAFLACALAPHIDSRLDLGKIAQFAIVHDLVEVYAGDSKVFDTSTDHAGKGAREQAALSLLKKNFSAFPWLTDTISSYESGQTSEAQFVYAVDKYIAVAYDLIDQGECLRELGVTQAIYDEFRAKHRLKAHRHTGVGRYYDEILNLMDNHPEYFAAS
jgi:putative hydrolase of HD superfamily